MAQTIVTVENNPLDYVKDVFWLAWQACGGPLGMGFLRDNPGATREEVWENVRSSGDYAWGDNTDNNWRADYVFGRMMKFTVELDDDQVTISGSGPDPDYQAWSREYPSYQALADAALKLQTAQ